MRRCEGGRGGGVGRLVAVLPCHCHRCAVVACGRAVARWQCRLSSIAFPSFLHLSLLCCRLFQELQLERQRHLQLRYAFLTEAARTGRPPAPTAAAAAAAGALVAGVVAEEGLGHSDELLKGELYLYAGGVGQAAVEVVEVEAVVAQQAHALEAVGRQEHPLLLPRSSRRTVSGPVG